MGPADASGHPGRQGTHGAGHVVPPPLPALTIALAWCVPAQPTTSAASFVANMHNAHGRLRGTLEALIIAADEAGPMLPGHSETLGMLADELDTSKCRGRGAPCPGQCLIPCAPVLHAAYDLVVDTKPFTKVARKFLNDTNAVLAEGFWADLIKARSTEFTITARAVLDAEVMQGVAEHVGIVEDKLDTVQEVSDAMADYHSYVTYLSNKLPESLATFSGIAANAMGRMPEELEAMDAAFNEYGTLDSADGADDDTSAADASVDALLAANAAPTTNATVTLLLEESAKLAGNTAVLKAVHEAVAPSTNALRDAWSNARSVREGLHFLQTADLTSSDALRTAMVNFIGSVTGDVVVDHADSLEEVYALVERVAKERVMSVPALAGPIIAARAEELQSTAIGDTVEAAGSATTAAKASIVATAGQVTGASMLAAADAAAGTVVANAVDAWTATLTHGAAWLQGLGTSTGDLAVASAEASSWLTGDAIDVLRNVQTSATALAVDAASAARDSQLSVLHQGVVDAANNVTAALGNSDQVWRLLQAVTGIALRARTDADTGEHALEQARAALAAVRPHVFEHADEVAATVSRVLAPAVAQAQLQARPTAAETAAIRARVADATMPPAAGAAASLLSQVPYNATARVETDASVEIYRDTSDLLDVLAVSPAMEAAVVARPYFSWMVPSSDNTDDVKAHALIHDTMMSLWGLLRLLRENTWAGHGTEEEVRTAAAARVPRQRIGSRTHAPCIAYCWCGTDD